MFGWNDGVKNRRRFYWCFAAFLLAMMWGCSDESATEEEALVEDESSGLRIVVSGLPDYIEPRYLVRQVEEEGQEWHQFEEGEADDPSLIDQGDEVPMAGDAAEAGMASNAFSERYSRETTIRGLEPGDYVVEAGIRMDGSEASYRPDEPAKEIYLPEGKKKTVEVVYERRSIKVADEALGFDEENDNAQALIDTWETVAGDPRAPDYDPEDDRRRLVFDPSLLDEDERPGLDSLVAFDEHELLPLGYLGRVVEVIEDSDERLEVEARRAGLPELIESGGLHGTTRIESQDTEIEVNPEVEGVEAFPVDPMMNQTMMGAFFGAPGASLGDDGFCFTFNDVEVYSSGDDDEVMLNGDWCIDAGVDVDVSIDGLSLDYASAGVTVRTSGEIGLDFDGEVEFSTRVAVPFATLRLPPIKFKLGVVPVSIHPVLVAKAEVGAGMEGDMHVTVSASARVSTGFRYDGDVDAYLNTTASASPRISQRIQRWHTRFGVGPELELLIYDAVGPTFGFNPFVEVDVDADRQDWWHLYGGVSGFIGVRLQVPGLRFINFSESWRVAGRKWLLARKFSDFYRYDVEVLDYPEGKGVFPCGEGVAHVEIIDRDSHGEPIEEQFRFSNADEVNILQDWEETDDGLRAVVELIWRPGRYPYRSRNDHTIFSPRVMLRTSERSFSLEGETEMYLKGHGGRLLSHKEAVPISGEGPQPRVRRVPDSEPAYLEWEETISSGDNEFSCLPPGRYELIVPSYTDGEYFQTDYGRYYKDVWRPSTVNTGWQDGWETLEDDPYGKKVEFRVDPEEFHRIDISYYEHMSFEPTEGMLRLQLTDKPPSAETSCTVEPVDVELIAGQESVEAVELTTDGWAETDLNPGEWDIDCDPIEEGEAVLEAVDTPRRVEIPEEFSKVVEIGFQGQGPPQVSEVVSDVDEVSHEGGSLTLSWSGSDAMEYWVNAVERWPGMEGIPYPMGEALVLEGAEPVEVTLPENLSDEPREWVFEVEARGYYDGAYMEDAEEVTVVQEAPPVTNEIHLEVSAPAAADDPTMEIEGPGGYQETVVGRSHVLSDVPLGTYTVEASDIEDGYYTHGTSTTSFEVSNFQTMTVDLPYEPIDANIHVRLNTPGPQGPPAGVAELMWPDGYSEDVSSSFNIITHAPTGLWQLEAQSYVDGDYRYDPEPENVSADASAGLVSELEVDWEVATGAVAVDYQLPSRLDRPELTLTNEDSGETVTTTSSETLPMLDGGTWDVEVDDVIDGNAVWRSEAADEVVVVAGETAELDLPFVQTRATLAADPAFLSQEGGEVTLEPELTNPTDDATFSVAMEDDFDGSVQACDFPIDGTQEDWEPGLSCTLEFDEVDEPATYLAELEVDLGDGALPMLTAEANVVVGNAVLYEADGEFPAVNDDEVWLGVDTTSDIGVDPWPRQDGEVEVWFTLPDVDGDPALGRFHEEESEFDYWALPDDEAKPGRMHIVEGGLWIGDAEDARLWYFDRDDESFSEVSLGDFDGGTRDVFVDEQTSMVYALLPEDERLARWNPVVELVDDWHVGPRPRGLGEIRTDDDDLLLAFSRRVDAVADLALFEPSTGSVSLLEELPIDKEGDEDDPFYMPAAVYDLVTNPETGHIWVAGHGFSVRTHWSDDDDWEFFAGIEMDHDIISEERVIAGFPGSLFATAIDIVPMGGGEVFYALSDGGNGLFIQGGIRRDTGIFDHDYIVDLYEIFEPPEDGWFEESGVPGGSGYIPELGTPGPIAVDEQGWIWTLQLGSDYLARQRLPELSP